MPEPNHLANNPYTVIITPVAATWKGVRVVDGNGLENRRAGNGTVGSNPTPSAKLGKMHMGAIWELFQTNKSNPI